MGKTEKFNKMLEAFECDFSLAEDGESSLEELIRKLISKDEKLLTDIDLLKELSFLLRHGQAEIHLVKDNFYPLYSASFAGKAYDTGVEYELVVVTKWSDTTENATEVSHKNYYVTSDSKPVLRKFINEEGWCERIFNNVKDNSIIHFVDDIKMNIESSSELVKGLAKGDLISRSKLLGCMNERYISVKDDCPDNLAEGFMQMDKLIHQQPCAYDVEVIFDNIVKKLEKEEEDCILSIPDNAVSISNPIYQKWMMKSYGFAEAKKIVMKEMGKA